MSELDRGPQGRFLGVPYDWRRPTLERMRGRLWDPTDDRVLQPTAFGWGWTFNVHRALVNLGVIEPQRDRPD